MKYRKVRLALGAAALMSSACTQTTTIIRSDGWHYDGPLLSSDANSVTIEGHKGPITIPRSEVVDYDLPGNGLIIAGVIFGVSGLSELAGRSEGQAIEDGSEARPTRQIVEGVVGIAIGVGLAGWGWWIWRDAQESWRGPATEISVGAHGVLVRF